MTKKRKTYHEKAERLSKTVDIAEKIISNSKSLDEKTKKHFIDWGKKIKELALNPEPQFKTVASLKYLENDFLIYWNEADSIDVEDFWKEIYKKGIDFEKKDTIQDVLKRKKIKNIHEYNNIIDNIVVAEQIGRINKDQVIELNNLLGKFEKKYQNK